MKTADFSETFAASDPKVGRSRHLIEFMSMKVSIEGQGHFLTLAQGCVHTLYKNSNQTFSETTLPL